MSDNASATKKDLADLGEDLRKEISDSEDRLVTVMREIETKLLRGFFDYAESTDLRLRKLKADVSNVDAVTEQRVDRLEHRIRRIEHRLDYGDNPTAPPVPPAP